MGFFVRLLNTMELPNKGHIGDTINLAVLSYNYYREVILFLCVKL